MRANIKLRISLRVEDAATSREVLGRSDAASLPNNQPGRGYLQVGNDNIKGMAFNDGYTQLWSQERLAQWANMSDAEHEHYAGGYGYLNVGGRVSKKTQLAVDDAARAAADIGG